LNPLDHLHPFVTGVAPTTVFDSDPFLYTHLGLSGFSGFYGLSLFTLCAMRYALCDFLQQLPHRPAPVHINDLTRDEV
jgi:hypothetical protein